MKKATQLIAAALVLAMLLAGCGQPGEGVAVPEQTGSAVETTATVTPAEQETEATPETTESSTVSEPSAEAQTSAEATSMPGQEISGAAEGDGQIALPDTFAETVLIDNENCKVTVTGFTTGIGNDVVMQMSLENKTDINLMFTVEWAAINGVMDDPFWADEVAAGKILNTEIYWSAEDLQKKMISKLSAVEFMLRAYDSDNWEAEDLLAETVTVYPFGEDQAEYVAREDQASDVVLYADDAVRVIATGFDPQGEYGNTVGLYLENHTEQTLTMTADDCAVNGVMADPIWVEEVAPGKVAFSEMNWYLDSTIETLGITDITEVTGTLRAYDSDDWSADDVVNAPFTYTPQGPDAVSLYTYTPGAQDVILADNDQFQFIVIGFEKDDMNYQYMKVFINNKTDKTLMFSAENVAINGYMCDPYWAMSVAPGKMAMGRFSWSDADLSANGIESIEEVEFALEVYDDDTFEDVAQGNYTVAAW